MCKPFKLLILSFILNPPVWASLERSVTAPDSSCIQDVTDSYDPHLRILSGPNQGKCLDTSLVRSVILLIPDRTRMNGVAHKFRIANFVHQDQQWIAEFYSTGVDSVIFQIQHDLMPLRSAHVQLRLHFKAGQEVTLLGQTAKNQADSLVIDDMIVSIQSVFSTDTYSRLLKSSENNNQFVLAYRMLSTEQKRREMIIDPTQKGVVEQILLDLDEVQKMNVLFSSILMSDLDRMSSFYDHLNRNSVTETFSILDHAVLYSDVRKSWIDANRFSLSSMNSLQAAWALWIRGLYREQISNFENRRYR